MKNSSKLVIVGTVAAVCAIGAFLANPMPSASGMNFLSVEGSEVEQAFIQHIALYGKSYTSKSEYPFRFELFAKNFKMVQEHNSKPQSMYKMGLSKFADMSSEEILGNVNFTPEDL